MQELLDASLEQTSERNGKIAGEDCRLECRRVGEQVVVVIEPHRAPVCAAAQRLTPRERQSLALVAKGLTRNEIAVQLGVRPCTVRTHLEHARERLGARSGAEAVAKWMAAGQ